jgi:hypothetical protein
MSEEEPTVPRDDVAEMVVWRGFSKALASANEPFLTAFIAALREDHYELRRQPEHSYEAHEVASRAEMKWPPARPVDSCEACFHESGFSE